MCVSVAELACESSAGGCVHTALVGDLRDWELEMVVGVLKVTAGAVAQVEGDGDGRDERYYYVTFHKSRCLHSKTVVS